MTRLILLLFILLPFSGFSQKLINQKKEIVKKELGHYINDNKSINATLSETDTSLVLNIPGSTTQRASFEYFFDKEGKCSSQKTMAHCDSCINKYLQEALKEDQYKWRKINENQYISSFEEKLMIEIPADGKEFSFMILRTDWSKILYDMITELKQ